MNKNNYRQGILASGIGFFLSLFIYLILLQSPYIAKREFAYFLLFWLAFTPLIYLLLSRFLLPRLETYTPKARRNWILLTVGIGILFALVTRPPQVLLFLPVHQLKIIVPAGSPYRSITLEYAKTSLRDIGFGEFIQEGEWKRTEIGFTHTGSEPASLSWSGRTGDSASLVFTNSPALQGIQAGWDGNIVAVDPGDSPSAPVIVVTSLNKGLTSVLFSHLLTGFVFAFLFLILTLFLVSVRLYPAPVVHRKWWYWLLFTLPMIAVWGIYLMTFFPAIMTPDSIRQWGQVMDGQFNDALPVVHTLLVILLTRIWFSPAAVIVFQVITLALTVAWGIKMLSEHGLPTWAGWGLSALFAISPVNGYMAATLWKDIPYSTCLLLMSLIFLKIVLRRGEWLKRKSAWLWLVLVSLGISLFRLNGLPVPVVSLIVLALVYREHWKRVAFSLGVFLGAWLLIEGPVYDYLNVDRNTGFKEQVFIHHIAAHVATGGPLTAEEASVASGILPIDQWDYDCCTNIPIWRQPAYSEPRFTEKAAEIRKLFMGLAFKEPDVELRHMVCVSSLIWELPNHCALKQEKLANWQPTWIEPNDLGLKENSLLPVLATPLTMIKDFTSRQPWDLFFYTPAVFLYLGLYCTAIFAYRAKQTRYLLYFLPAAVQSAVMLLINVSRDFRYQYGVYLMGLFSLGLLILALSQPIRNPNPSLHEMDNT
jgi:hypothetical protein